MLPVPVSFAFLAHFDSPLLLLGLFGLLLLMSPLPAAPWTHSWVLPCHHLSWSWAWCFIALASWLPAAWNNCVWGELMLLFFFCLHCLSMPSPSEWKLFYGCIFFLFYESIIYLKCLNFCSTAEWFRCLNIYIAFYILFHYGLSQDMEYSSPCRTVGPCCFSLLCIIVYIC